LRLRFARVPVLPGCAARGILESMRAHGDTLPMSDLAAGYSGQLRLRLPRSLHERLSRMAALDGVSLNQELVALLASSAGARSERAPSSRQPRKR